MIETMQEEVDAQKRRKGLVRLWHATRYSIEGLRAAWHEAAFRQELIASVVLGPLAFWIGKSWLERSVLLGSVIAVLVVELLNTALESALDRVGSEWHPLAKRAKDMGSAAVLLTLMWCAITWLDAVYTLLRN